MVTATAKATAAAAEATLAAAVTLVSNAAGLMATTILQRLPCSKNWKPYKIETKDIGIQAYYVVLQLGVGC
jgi:hypothetical protein